MEQHIDAQMKNLATAVYHSLTETPLTEEEHLAMKSAAHDWHNLSEEQMALFWREYIKFERTQIPKVRKIPTPEKE